jgi:transketolase
MKNWHKSQRGFFAGALYEEMKKNHNIFVITGDLGYGMLDKIRDDFPERFINCGASEQAMVGIAIGLAQEGKIPFVYSITPFLLYRPYEWLRNYLQREGVAVKLVGSGRGKDYLVDGWTHWCGEEYEEDALRGLPKIIQFWPGEKERVPKMVKEMITNKKPSFISLQR